MRNVELTPWAIERLVGIPPHPSLRANGLTSLYNNSPIIFQNDSCNNQVKPFLTNSSLVGRCPFPPPPPSSFMLFFPTCRPIRNEIHLAADGNIARKRGGEVRQSEAESAQLTFDVSRLMASDPNMHDIALVFSQDTGLMTP